MLVCLLNVRHFFSLSGATPTRHEPAGILDFLVCPAPLRATSLTPPQWPADDVARHPGPAKATFELECFTYQSQSLPLMAGR